jgi:drug/metabolite transporter (DMT)-like permease
MSLMVFEVVLFAALLHAIWNAIVKSAPDKLLTTILVASAAAGVSAAFLPFLKAPAAASIPYLIASALLQIAYFLLVARIYQVADMSQAYPLMRGAAPLIVAVATALGREDALSPFAWTGVPAISSGVVLIAMGSPLKNRQGIRLALLNALVIAAYTMIDGLGVRKSGAPAAYTLWVFLLSGLPLGLWAVRARSTLFFPHLRRHWCMGIVGGMGATTSYGLALWAMTIAPIAVVAALRETSILFGTLIALVVLREAVGPWRLLSACIIAGGAAILRLA